MAGVVEWTTVYSAFPSLTLYVLSFRTVPIGRIFMASTVEGMV
ncbi:MAG: hypothetical protein ABI119_03315 [Gemmatimonadaceae bacterium]